MMERLRSLRIIAIIVIAYMMAALGWWAVLLLKKNKEIRDLKSELTEAVKQSDKQLESEILEKFERQNLMVYGEAAVFGLSLLIGIILINRAHKKEIQALQQRRNFLLSITHELKSPIASINLILQTLKKRKLNADISEDLRNNALQESKRLEALVDNLLIAAKIDSAYEPDIKEIDLSEMTSQLMQNIKKRHSMQDFNTDIEEGIKTMVDQIGIPIIFNNLIDNAVKYGEGKPITVELKGTANTIILSVRDLGIGIPEAEKKNVFQQFYRIGSEETRKHKGTGLGLFIVKRLSDASKGLLEIRDNSPTGTIFTLKLIKQ